MKKIFTLAISCFSALVFSQTPVAFSPDSGLTGTSFGTVLDIKNNDIAVATAKAPFVPAPLQASKVYTFTSDGGVVAQTQTLFPADAQALDCFGYSLSLGDGVLAVGSPLHDEGAVNAGAVYIYEKNIAGTWVQAQKILSNLPHFGSNVKLYGDFLFVSANSDNTLDGEIITNSPIKVFKKDGTQWQLFQTIPVIGNAFGGKMDVKNNTLIVAEANESGYPVFHRIVLGGNGQWALQATSHPIDNLEFHLTDFSFENNIIYAIGMHLEGHDEIHTFTYNGTWESQLLLSLMPPSGDQQFTTILVSNDKMFAGSDRYVLGMERKFPLLYFKKSLAWSLQGVLYGTSATPNDDYFGSVLAADGDDVLVGAPQEGIIGQGMAYVLDMTLGNEAFEKNPIVVYPNPTTDKVHFENATIDNAKVYGITGNLLLHMNGPLTELSLGHLAPGIYLVKADTKDGQSQTFKIVKN